MKLLHILKNNKIAISFLVYLSVSLFLLNYFGIQLNGEAEKYMDDANRILNGQPLRNGNFGISYIGYSLTVLIFIKFNISFFFVGVFQCLLSFFAAWCMYKLFCSIDVNKKIAFIFFIAYLLCLPIQKWNFFLYTESLHTSIIVIAFYYMHRIFSNNFNNWIIASLLIIAIVFTRPVGIVFIVALMAVALYCCFKNGYKVYAFACVAILISIGVLFIFSPYATYINPDSFRRMEIICQVPQANVNIQYHEINKSGLSAVFYTIKDEIGIKTFFVVGLKKLVAFYGLYRPYYSLLNNSVLLCYTLFYPLAIIGLFVKVSQQAKYTKLFSIVYILLTSILIFLTCDEWSNRFICPLFPFILFLAAIGFNNLVKRLNRLI
jgi:hypothetical protein